MKSTLSSVRQSRISEIFDAVRRAPQFTHNGDDTFFEVYRDRAPSSNTRRNRFKWSELTPILQRVARYLSPRIARNDPTLKSFDMVFREVHDIASYTQPYHVDIVRSPAKGVIVNQVIYYVDTPRYSNGRQANVNNSGPLLLFSNKRHRRVNPSKGTRLNFDPFTTVHATGQKPSNAPPVNRKMIILLLYRYPTGNENTTNVNRQLYAPQRFNRLGRVVTGTKINNSESRMSSISENMLSRMFSGLKVRSRTRRPRVSKTQIALMRARGLRV